MLRIEFNDHQYQGTNQCQDRLQKLLDGRGITGPGDPRLVHLDGQFFVSTKTVRKLANWMLRNTHLANRSVDLEHWISTTRATRPGSSGSRRNWRRPTAPPDCPAGPARGSPSSAACA